MDSKISRTESVKTLHTKKRMQHKRKSTSGSQPRDVNHRRASLSRRQNSSNGNNSNNGGDDPMNWESMATDWRRCETMWITWDGGHGPFNLNATSWPDDQPYGSDSGALQWDIARLVGNHDYQWTARAPPNTTFYFDLTDTSTGQRISSLLQLHINGDYAEGLSSCIVNYEGVTTPTAGQQLAGSTSTLVASSAYIDPSSLSGSTAYNSTIPTSSTEADGEASTSTPTHSSKVEKGLSAGVALLALALIGMLFMQYRLRKRLARLQKGQSTVGRWMNHHHQQRRGNEQHNLDYTRDDGESTMSHESQSDSKMKLMSSSSNVYATSDSSNGRLSSFFERESASRAGASGLLEDQNTSTRRTSSSINRPSSSIISPMSPSISNDPFADSTEDDDDDDDDESIHRSASQQKRYSQAESAISDSTTRTSATGRTITSSIAPSEGQSSSVGNVSVVSDEYYHRSKACTITPGASLERKAGQFLEPHLALLDSRR